MSSQLVVSGILSNDLETASQGLVATKTPKTEIPVGAGRVGAIKAKDSRETTVLFIASSFRNKQAMEMNHPFDEGSDHFLPYQIILHIFADASA